MVASLPTLWTTNLLVEGLVHGLIISVLAMAIVLVYRSSRVINFALSDLGAPSAAILAIMVVKSHAPYWPTLIFVLLVGAAGGAVVEMAVIRRLAKAPRVIVLVATIGVAELGQFVTRTLPEYRVGKFQTAYPSPITSHWNIASIDLQGYQLLVLIVVPAITVSLWWLLGHTSFGESVRATATNADLARLTGVSPKLVSTAIWTITGFLGAVAVVLLATQQGSTDLVSIGPQTMLEALIAALIGRMTSFPWAVIGAIIVGETSKLLSFHYGGIAGLDQFFFFVAALALVARMSRVDESGGESFAFAPRVPPVPERLREIWWVRYMPQLMALFAVAVACLVGLVVTKSEQRLNYEVILAVAIAAVSVVVLTGWAGQLSLGQMAFGGLGALSAAGFVRGITLNIGWRSHRYIRGSVRPVPLLVAFGLVVGGLIVFDAARRSRQRTALIGTSIAMFVAAALSISFVLDRRLIFDPDAGTTSPIVHPLPFVPAIFVGAMVACLAAVVIGIGALRIKGLLLAISTMAFAVASAGYIFARPLFSPGNATSVALNRGKVGPIDLAAFGNVAYYWFALALLVVVLILIGHLRRTGIGRMIIGVRENEPGAAALTVSPTRAKLTAFAVAGYVAGLGGAVLGGALVNIGYNEDGRFTFYDSIRLVAMTVIGGLGSIAGAVTGALWVVGLPMFFSGNETVGLFTSSIGLLIILLYLPGGFTQVFYWLRGLILGIVEKRMPEVATKTLTAPPVSLRRPVLATATTNADGSVLATAGLTVKFGGLVAVDHVDFHAMPGEVIGLIGTNGAGKSTLLNAIGGFVPSEGNVQLMGRDVSRLQSHLRARAGLGRTFQAATLFPELTVRETVQLALEAREPTPFWGSLFFWAEAKEHRKRWQAAELIDFLGLGRYADRFIAELSTGTRRIVELTSMLAVAPRVICLDEPTAGVAQREAEAFGPLIKRVQQELDATLIVVEHDLPLILSISDRVYCLEAGAVIAEGTPAAVRANPLVVASYLGTDERAIQRSNAAV